MPSYICHVLRVSHTFGQTQIVILLNIADPSMAGVISPFIHLLQSPIFSTNHDRVDINWLVSPLNLPFLGGMLIGKRANPLQ